MITKNSYASAMLALAVFGVAATFVAPATVKAQYDGVPFTDYSDGGSSYTGYGSDYGSYTGYGDTSGSYSGYGDGYGSYTGYGDTSGSYSGYGDGYGSYTGYGDTSGSYSGYGDGYGSYTGYGDGSGSYTGYGDTSGSYTGYGDGYGSYTGYGDTTGSYTGYGDTYGSYTGYGAYPTYSYKDYYKPTSYYGGSTYSYYPTYTYTPPASNYNNNQNTNVNNNNVNVNVGGGSTNTQYCPSGYTGTYPNCYPPVQYCPSGYTGTYPNCYPPTHNQNVSCNLDASDTSVSSGDRVTLTWDTSGNPNYASINQGIGSVDRNGGSERVTVDNDTTYRMTVRNSFGDEDTCTVTVNVDDNNNNFSSVSFTGTPVNNPPVVYLSSIPYTGLEDIDPVLLSYWFMLIAAAGAGVWFLYRKGMIPTFAFASVEPTDDAETEVTTEEAPAETSPEVMSFLSVLAHGDTDAAVDHLRDAAASGTGVEEFLAEAEVAATDADLQAKVSAALEASKQTGIRGAKIALA